MKRAAHITLSVILILLFSSCEDDLKMWDRILFPDKQVFCWSAEYEINGEKKEDEKYAYRRDLRCCLLLPLTVGVTIHIAHGIITQPIAISSYYSDTCHELIKD